MRGLPRERLDIYWIFAKNNSKHRKKYQKATP